MKKVAYDNASTVEIPMGHAPVGRGLFLGLLDFLLLNIAFWGMHWIKFHSFSITQTHKELLLVMQASWLITLLHSKKIIFLQREAWWQGLKIITRANLILIMLVSLAIISFRLMDASRLQAYGTCLFFYGLEVLSLFLLSYTHGEAVSPPKTMGKPVKATRENRSSLLVAIDGILLLLSLLVAFYVYKRAFLVSRECVDYVIINLALWLLTSLATGKFNKDNFKHLNLWLSATIKSLILMVGGLSIVYFGMRFVNTTRFIVFGPLLIYFTLEFGLFYISFLYFKYGGNIHDLEDVQQIGNIIGADRPPIEEARDRPINVVNEPVAPKLKHALEFFNPKLFDFIDANIDLLAIDRTEAVLLSTDNLFNVHSLDQGKIRLCINLHKLNDMRWFNKYFLSVHTKLVTGGFLVGHALTIETQKIHFYEDYPKYLRPILFALHFFWHRVMPKMPWIRKFYFALTKGRNRTVSKAEVLGRIYFCGFKLVAERILNNRFLFIAQKVQGPSLENNPTYGPLIRLKRFGGGNRMITVYKFRTMYPYSEYLQQYIYERNKLELGGKFKSDFRITAWGAFLRKTWLDELPMLYNWLKGDLKLIGVRPISNQYLNLYNSRVRHLREKVKPGLIPPFYADLPTTLEEIQESEEKYITSYLQQPFVTQLIYLYKSVTNILINNARSS